MKEYTENELKTKAEAYCAKTERCPFGAPSRWNRN